MPSGARHLRRRSLDVKSSRCRRRSLADARHKLWVMPSSLSALHPASLCRAERGIFGGAAWTSSPRDAAGDPSLTLGMNSGSMPSSLPALHPASLCRAERGIFGGAAWTSSPRDTAGDPSLALGMNSGSCSLHFPLFIDSIIDIELIDDVLVFLVDHFALH